MAKKEHKSQISQQDPAAQTSLTGQEKETRSSPVCYANAPELRPDFLSEEDVASIKPGGPLNKPVERLERTKPASDSSK